jgi:hypothetical protein
MTFSTCSCEPGGPDLGTADLASGGKKRVFVTNTTYSGNLGGLTGADGLCTGGASAAGIGGNWKAWVSDAATGAASRLAEVGPWYLLDGTMAFTGKGNLVTQPLVAINLTEKMQTLVPSATFPFVWTGTHTGGTPAVDTCIGWADAGATANGMIGSPLSPNGWTESSSGSAACNNSYHIYCFEQ